MLAIGDRGSDVCKLQEQLVLLGFEPIVIDGVFGPVTRWAVLNLQAMFGYDIDGAVGTATARLIAAQVGYKWNARSPRAQLSALKAQGLVRGHTATVVYN